MCSSLHIYIIFLKYIEYSNVGARLLIAFTNKMNEKKNLKRSREDEEDSNTNKTFHVSSISTSIPFLPAHTFTSMFYFQSQKNQPFTNISTNLLVITKYLCARCRYASYIAIAISVYDVHAIYAHYSFKQMLLYLSITCERNEEKCRVINGNLLIKYPVIIIKVLSIWCLLLCI